MYNANRPSREELPSSATLLRSTFLAILGAGAILVTVVLPSEYGIDPTGIGRVLGLTEMGQIKMQLAAEAAAGRNLEPDAERIGGATPPAVPPAVASKSAGPVDGPTAAGPPVESADAGRDARSDEITIELAPGEGTEIKLRMHAGDQADFEWTANGSILNYDQHGSGDGRSISYEKGRGVAGDTGVLEAAFDGNHGWFWRNRTSENVKLTLRTSGSYLELKRVL